MAEKMSAYWQMVNAVVKMPFDWHLFNGANVLVTGATGLIGSFLVDVLMSADTDCKVFAAGRNADRASRLFGGYSANVRFNFIKVDITQPLSSDIDFHYVFHAASDASPKAFAENPVGIVKANVLGICNLMDYGVRHNMRRMLFVSSGEVYGTGSNGEWCETDCGFVDSMQMRSSYPVSKRMAENLCVAYSSQYGVEAVVARLCHVYGPRFTENDNRVYAQFIRNAVEGNDIVLKSDGSQYRSWICVADCVSALVLLMLNGKPAEAYNVANGESNITILQLAEMIASLCSREVRFDKATTIESKVFNPMTRAVFNTDKLQSLGWSPLFPIRDGLRLTIESIKEGNKC